MKTGWVKGLLLTMMTTIAAQGAVSKANFGKTPGGQDVEIYTLKNASIEARIMTYGARIVSIKTADKTGKVEDVVLGAANFDDYLKGKNGSEAELTVR